MIRNFESRPDKEGIKTPELWGRRFTQFVSLESRPEEEGIKTSYLLLVSLRSAFESRPDKEGIKTQHKTGIPVCAV